MGTSTSYTAPTSGKWSWAKRIAGQFSAQGGSGGPITTNQVANTYVSALGGASTAASSSISGQATARGFGGFLSGVAAQGLSSTLASIGLSNLIGQNTNAVLLGLVNYLAGANNTLEEAIARTAMDEVLFREFGSTQTFEELEDLFSKSVNQQEFSRIFGEFIAEYIYQRMVSELGAKIESGAVNPASAHRIEEDLKTFIFERVALANAQQNFQDVDWSGTMGKEIVNHIFNLAYEQLEMEQ